MAMTTTTPTTSLCKLMTVQMETEINWDRCFECLSLSMFLHPCFHHTKSLFIYTDTWINFDMELLHRHRRQFLFFLFFCFVRLPSQIFQTIFIYIHSLTQCSNNVVLLGSCAIVLCWMLAARNAEQASQSINQCGKYTAESQKQTMKQVNTIQKELLLFSAAAVKLNKQSKCINY